MDHKLAMDDIYTILAQPAIRALQNAGIISVEILCGHTEKELLSLHGFGKSGLQRMKIRLQEYNLSLKE